MHVVKIKIISSEEHEHTGKVMNLEFSYSVPVVGITAGLWTDPF